MVFVPRPPARRHAGRAYYRYRRGGAFRKRRYGLKHRRRVSAIPKRMRQPVYNFIRKYQYILDPAQITGTTANPYGWLQGVGSTSFGIESGQGIQQTFAMSLSSLVNYSEFTRLFRYHKINAIKMEFIPCGNTTLIGGGTNTTDPTDSANGPQSANNGLILRSKRNQSGYTITNTSSVADWLQTTGVKKQVIPTTRTTTVYMKTTQTSELMGGYPVVTRPQWTPTVNYNAPFYGLDLRIDSIDGTALENVDFSKWPKFTVHVTAYLSFKGTQ